jgi:hypothetical protein
MRFGRLNFPYEQWVVAGFLLCFLVYGVYQMQATQTRTEHMGDQMDLRSTNIIAVRFSDSAQAQLQRLDIFEEGGAAASAIPAKVGVRVRRLALSSADMADLQTFRQMWCTNPQTFRAPNRGETYYDVAVRCEGYDTKQAQVPEGELPTLLASIVRRMPP